MKHPITPNWYHYPYSRTPIEPPCYSCERRPLHELLQWAVLCDTPASSVAMLTDYEEIRWGTEGNCLSESFFKMCRILSHSVVFSSLS